MQTYDLTMLVLLAVTTLWGAWRGLASQLASLTALVASYFVALRYSPTLAPWFGEEEPLNRFLAMLVIYVLTSLAVWLVCRRVKRFIKRVELTDFDHQLGGLFGAIKGVLLCVVITFFVVSISEPARQTVLQSRSGHYIALALHRADPIMPPELHKVLDPYVKPLEHRLDPHARPNRRDKLADRKLRDSIFKSLPEGFEFPSGSSGDSL